MKRRDFLRATAALAASSAVVGAGQAEPPIRKQDSGSKDPIDVASRKQLFLDDKFIASSEMISTTVNPPTRCDAIDFPPLKGMSISGYLAVLEVDGSYRLYYHAAPDSNPARYTTCLSTSEDGINWVHPKIGLYDVDGSDNVVLPMPAEGTVFIDPNETDGYRFWWVGTPTEGGPSPSWTESQGTFNGTDKDGRLEGALYLFRSNDGIHWERNRNGVAMPYLCDSHNQIFFDSLRNEYAAYVRGWNLSGTDRSIAATLFSVPVIPARRFVARTSTPSLKQLPFHFEQSPGVQRGSHGFYGVLLPENALPVIEADGEDPPQTDVYTPCVNPYPWADSCYLGFPSIFRHYDGQVTYGRDHRGKFIYDGVIGAQLAISRDGVSFRRYRVPYLSPGLLEENGFGGILFMGVGLIRRGNFIYQYFTESPLTHNFPGKNGEAGGVGGAWRSFHVRMAKQRLDGFVSVDAGPGGGTLTTPPLHFQGNQLQLNIDCGALGEGWVELQDQNCNPIAGYAMKDSVSVDRNGITQSVWWKSGPDVSRLAGRPVRLFIKLRSAKLYAFQFVFVKS